MLDNRFYVFGGSGINIGSQNFNDLWLLKIEGNNIFTFSEIKQYSSKSSGSSRPPGMYGHSLNCIGNYLYVFGGTTGFDYFKDVHRYCLVTNMWNKVMVASTGTENIPEARYKHCTV